MVFDESTNTLWAIGDGDNSTYKDTYLLKVNLNTLDKVKVKIENAKNIDWEAIQLNSKGHVLIFDVGGNNLKRKQVVTYVIDPQSIDYSTKTVTPKRVVETAMLASTFDDEGEEVKLLPERDIEAAIYYKHNVFLIEKNWSFYQPRLSKIDLLATSVKDETPHGYLGSKDYLVMGLTDADADDNNAFFLSYNGLFSCPIQSILSNEPSYAKPHCFDSMERLASFNGLGVLPQTESVSVIGKDNILIGAESGHIFQFYNNRFIDKLILGDAEIGKTPPKKNKDKAILLAKFEKDIKRLIGSLLIRIEVGNKEANQVFLKSASEARKLVQTLSKSTKEQKAIQQTFEDLINNYRQTLFATPLDSSEGVTPIMEDVLFGYHVIAAKYKFKDSFLNQLSLNGVQQELIGLQEKLDNAIAQGSKQLTTPKTEADFKEFTRLTGVKGKDKILKTVKARKAAMIAMDDYKMYVSQALKAVSANKAKDSVLENYQVAMDYEKVKDSIYEGLFKAIKSTHKNNDIIIESLDANGDIKFIKKTIENDEFGNEIIVFHDLKVPPQDQKTLIDAVKDLIEVSEAFEVPYHPGAAPDASINAIHKHVKEIESLLSNVKTLKVQSKAGKQIKLSDDLLELAKELRFEIREYRNKVQSRIDSMNREVERYKRLGWKIPRHLIVSDIEKTAFQRIEQLSSNVEDFYSSLKRAGALASSVKTKFSYLYLDRNDVQSKTNILQRIYSQSHKFYLDYEKIVVAMHDLYEKLELTIPPIEETPLEKINWVLATSAINEIISISETHHSLVERYGNQKITVGGLSPAQVLKNYLGWLSTFKDNINDKNFEKINKDYKNIYRSFRRTHRYLKMYKTSKIDNQFIFTQEDRILKIMKAKLDPFLER